MSNSHAKKKKISKADRFLRSVRFYPDYGTDSDGYDFSPVKIGITVFGIILLIVTGKFAPGLPGWAGIVLYAAAFLCCASFCLVNLVYCFSGGRFLCESLPVILACILSFIVGYHRAPSFTVLLYVLVKLFAAWTERRAHRKADTVLSILPDLATVILSNGETERKKPKHLLAGDVVSVKRGEIVPVDGTVLEGMSSVDYTRFFNIPKPVAVREGSTVRAGGVNNGEEILVEADRDYNDSTAKRISSSFSAATGRKSEIEVLTVRIWNAVFPAVIALFLIFALIVPLISAGQLAAQKAAGEKTVTIADTKASGASKDKDGVEQKEETVKDIWLRNLRKAAVILLCCCPCGLLNTLELFTFSAIREMFSAGLILQDGRLISKLSRLETFVCNKTGTVTCGVYSVALVLPDGFSVEEPPQRDDRAVKRLLDLAIKAESASRHPIAAAIRSYCGYTEPFEPEGVVTNEIPGKGVEAFVFDSTVYCGNAALLYDHGINTPVPELAGTAVHIARDGQYIGYILLNDEARHGNYDALEALRSCGVRNLSLISSDLRSIVRPLASYASFSNVKAELSKEEKVRAVNYLAGACPEGRYVAFLGNGSEELETGKYADVLAVAGSLWDEAAWNGADLAVLRDGITSFPVAVSASCTASRLSALALYANLAVRAAVLVLAMIGVITLPVGMVLFAAVSAVSTFFTGTVK